MWKTLTWISLIIAALLFLYGIISALVGRSFMLSPGGCNMVSQWFLLAAANLSLIRLLTLKEEGK